MFWLLLAGGVVLSAGALIGVVAFVVRGPFVSSGPGITLRAKDASPERLEETVRFLSVELGPRDHLHTDNLDRAADRIARSMREAGLEVEEQLYTVGVRRYRNVIATRRGTDASAGAVIVGAHYDAFDELPAADDNASGVAVLLELVRTLPESAPRKTRLFVAFSTEEPPYFGSSDMGSSRFLDLITERGHEVDLMVALDLVGYFSDEPGSQSFPFPGLGLLYPTTGNFVAVVGDLGAGRDLRRVKRGMLASGLPVVSFRAPSAVPGVLWSDHLPFRQRGLSGVLVTDTAFLRNPHYHMPSDTPDTLDFSRMAGVVRGLHGVLELVDGTTIP